MKEFLNIVILIFFILFWTLGDLEKNVTLWRVHMYYILKLKSQNMKHRPYHILGMFSFENNVKSGTKKLNVGT